MESSIAVELNDSTAEHISICTIRSPLQSSKGLKSVRLGAGGANHASISYPPRALSAQSDTLRPLEDCSGLCMVHGVCMVKEIPPSNRSVRPQCPTRFQELVAGRCVISMISEKKLPHFQSTMYTELFAHIFCGLGATQTCGSLTLSG